jgi:hypothetical protein
MRARKRIGHRALLRVARSHHHAGDHMKVTHNVRSNLLQEAAKAGPNTKTVQTTDSSGTTHVADTDIIKAGLQVTEGGKGVISAKEGAEIARMVGDHFKTAYGEDTSVTEHETTAMKVIGNELKWTDAGRAAFAQTMESIGGKHSQQLQKMGWDAD